MSTLPDSQPFWFGYFASTDNNLGASASTRSVWEDIGGYYLFLKEEPSDWGTFEKNIKKLRPNLAPPNVLRCLWIENPNDSLTLWETSGLQAKATGASANIVWTVLRATGFIVGAYKFAIIGLGVLTYIEDSHGGGIGFSGGNFSGPGGGYSVSSISVSFDGAQLGAFVGTMAIPVPENTDTNDLWETLNIGLQYASEPRDPTTLLEHTQQEGFDPALDYIGAVKILYMPVFDGQTEALDLEIIFDPLNPTISTRTAISLFPSGGSVPSVNFDSHLRTTRGYPVKLEPLAAVGVLPNAQFVFGSAPVSANTTHTEFRYHLCPDGAFKMTVQTPESTKERTTNVIDSYQLLLGLSGIEYVTLGGADTDMIVFEGGNPAYMPVVNADSGQAPNVTEALTDLATTSHATIMKQSDSGVNPGYYAQPKEAPLYSGKNQRVDNILDFNAMQAFTLSSNTANKPNVFPVGVYSGLSDAFSELAREMENSSLAPYRHYKIGATYGVQSLAIEERNLRPKRRVRAVDDPLGVTPQGLVAELTPDYSDFDGLYLGNMPGTNYPKVDLTVIEGPFKEAIQSNQLFFVASNVEVLMQGTSVRYELTEGDRPYLEALNVPEATIDAVYIAVSTETQPFETETDFVDCISTAAGDYLDDFLKICGILKVEMDGWTFQLSPRSWRTNSETPTLMIAKFCNRSLLEMANDSSSWAWPEVAIPSGGGTIADTQRNLLNVLLPTSYEDVSEAYHIFFETVVNDPTWNGFLFLNAPVDISELPDDLKFLAAGIDLTQFYAHHIGFSQTPFHVVNGVPDLEQTAAFGLIDYVDTEDLYVEETIAFGFKTMQLSVRFANAALADFSAQVELMLNQLLAASLFKNQAARGNNLIIDGTYQRVGGTPSYAFALTGQNVFNTSDTALTDIEVLSVQLISSPSVTDEVLTTFILMGNLRFIKIEAFDMFSYGKEDDGTDGYLRFSGFAINMSFSLATPNEQTFVPHESGTSFDMSSSSEPRKNSLLNNFPLVVGALVASPNLAATGEETIGQTPEEMGYTSVSAPLDQSSMMPSWYGLQYVLDMGTLGALTGNKSVKINVLVAWSKGAEQADPPVYVGLKLPNIPAIGGSFPLQGVLKLGFRNFQFKTYDAGDGKLGYNLRLRRFALSVLVWSFPPGNTDIVLFGEPGNPKGSLGWYAAYSAEESASTTKNLVIGTEGIEEKKKRHLSRVEKRLISGRRKPPIN